MWVAGRAAISPSARSLRGWVWNDPSTGPWTGEGPSPLSRLDHALYLGRELQKAEWCLEQGLTYIQD